MKLPFKVAGLALIFSALSAFAQPTTSLTSQPLKVVVPFAPGGGTDLYARLLSNGLSKRGVQMVVENKPGASGMIAATAVARAKPDGRTILFASLGTLVSNAVLLDKLTYDPQKDFRGVTQIGYQPSLIVARPDAPFKDIRGLVAYAKANPEKINRGSPGAAIITNLAPLAFENKYGFKTTHIPFNGVAPGFIALVSGQIDIMGTGPSGIAPYVSDGRMTLLGVMGESRLPQFPNVQTFKEQGYDFNGNLWYGLSVPAGTPVETVKELNKIVNEVLNDRDFKERAREMSVEPKGSSPDEYDAYVRAETERWVPELKRIKASMDTK
ncbi:Bug family tripartite tricarboxylate transporter substrate binding protein [Ottowia thiooxydans]|uniref:Bug family tripartite tricarboxylate transporter substrate binding protein n=1 Tax=Ottowia thiooxydans TaxID=219182 RepID=UPI0004036C03|nr:tripartite tricarboxylate transporter substrate binding protein [Ottowia thiooxydans]